MIIVRFVFFLVYLEPGLAVLRIRGWRSGMFCIYKDQVLKNHVIAEHDVTDGLSCSMKCVGDQRCVSVNFKKSSTNSVLGAKCELNNVTVSGANKSDIERNADYDHITDSDEIPKSCSQIKLKNPSTLSGYFKVANVGCLLRFVYCDMENHGGGWTLATSIQNTNNNHLLSNSHNCFNSTHCVTYNTTQIATRKLSDQDIRKMAESEGVYRVDVHKPSASPYTVFYKIPSGAQYFSSSCDGNSCPRIITSHHYPYVWESSCKGISVGYAIGFTGLGMQCYHVFDSESPHDCPAGLWTSSKYATERALYGFTCWGNLGIMFKSNGFLFVK